MGLFNQFPFTNFHEMNLDWLISKMKEVCTGFSELQKEFNSLWQKVNQAILTGFEKVGFTIPITQDGKNAFVVSKTDTPKPYNGTTTAAFVTENHVSIDGGRNSFLPTVVFDNEYSGNGFVEKTPSGRDASWTIFEGVKSNTIKSGDASAHCFTAGGELRETGPNGYNEFGLFCGEVHNTGSNNGLLEGVEVHLMDGYNQDRSYKTTIRGIIARVHKDNNNPNLCKCFEASSEGTYGAVAYDIHENGKQIFDDGLKLTNGNFKHGRGIRLPWGAAITYEQKGSEMPLPVFHVDQTGATMVESRGGAQAVYIRTGDNIFRAAFTPTVTAIYNSSGKPVFHVDPTGATMVESRGGAQAVYIRTGDDIFRAAFTPTVTALYNSSGKPVFSVDSSGTLKLIINNQLRTISVNEQGQLIAQ